MHPGLSLVFFHLLFSSLVFFDHHHHYYYYCYYFADHHLQVCCANVVFLGSAGHCTAMLFLSCLVLTMTSQIGNHKSDAHRTSLCSKITDPGVCAECNSCRVSGVNWTVVNLFCFLNFWNVDSCMTKVFPQFIQPNREEVTSLRCSICLK